jgi:L-ectoine synthase
MKIIRINELTETNRQVEFTGGTSFRALVASDNMGFAMMKTVIPKGGPHHWHYQHHLEACYCIKGKGELVNLETGLRVLIVPDMVYAMDKNDDHTFEALEDTVLISVFNPPLTGSESHDENGVYKSESVLANYIKSKEIAEEILGCKNIYDAA